MVDLAQEWSRLPWVPDRRSIDEWARDNVTLPPAMSISGPFNPDISRHLLAPMKALQDGRTREVNCLASPRSAKTLIADVFAPYALAQDPGSLLWVFDNDDQANKHCETRLMPILKACDPVRNLLPRDRHKVRSTEIQLANGYYIHVCGSAMGNLQARGYRYLVCDEVWEWKLGRLSQAKTRVGDFRKWDASKVLCISQGGESGGEWWAQYTAGVMHEWEVPCLSCGEYQVPVWSAKHDDGRRYGIVYECDKLIDGTPDYQSAKRSVRYVCKFCGHEHTDCGQTQARWNSTGRYRVVNDGGDPTVLSYHWNNLICDKWPDVVGRWLNARHQSKRGNWEPLVNFFQKDLAEFSSQEKIQEADNPLARIEASADQAWPDEAFRFLTVDTQAGYFWVMARAWAKSSESRRLHWGQCKTIEEVEDLRVKLNIQRTAVIIDAAWSARTVYTWACNFGFICAIGQDKKGWKHKVDEPGKVSRWVEKPWSVMFHGDPDRAGLRVPSGSKARVFYVSKPSTAERLQGLRDRGLWTEPKVEPKPKSEIDYEAQMNSVVKVRRKPGEPEEWQQIGTEPHAWDCARMQVFAAMTQGAC